MKKEFNLTQPQRLVALFVDLIVVVCACWFLFHIPYPPLGDKGFWAYSSIIAVLVGSKLVTPFYVKPIDAISYAIPALVSLMLINGCVASATSGQKARLKMRDFDLLRAPSQRKRS